MRIWLARLLGVIAIAAGIWAAWIGVAGGVTLAIGRFVLTSNAAWRPGIISVVAAVAAIVLAGRSGARREVEAIGQRLRPVHGAVALAIATALISLTWNSRTASGPDPFAYLSQAALFRSGALDVPIPIAAGAPWPNAVATFTPFGYHAAPHDAPAFVPMTAPGLSLLMAAVQAVGGHCAAFLITPIAGGVLVWLTFATGVRVRSPMTGLIAAWLLATSPAFLYMLMWPMSDIVAAAWVAALVWMLLGASRRPSHLLMAGLLGSGGWLTRPNIVVVAGAAAIWIAVVAWRARGFRAAIVETIWFGAGLVPAAVVTILLNIRWNGGVLVSGYGSAGQIFALANLRENLAHYTQWLTETSPLIWLGVVAIVISIPTFWPRGRSAAALCLLVVASVAGVYLFSPPYPEWWYLRFLLPAYPVLFAGAATALVALARRGRPWGVLIAGIVLIAGVIGIRVARERGTFDVGVVERRYATVAEIVRANTEPTAVILTWHHAGTIRYYAGRDALRTDVLDPAWLDRALDWLRSQGRQPYILVEDFEQPVFESRFKAQNTQGALDYKPIAAWESARVPGWIWLYDPSRHTGAVTMPPPEMERTQTRCPLPHVQ